MPKRHTMTSLRLCVVVTFVSFWLFQYFPQPLAWLPQLCCACCATRKLCNIFNFNFISLSYFLSSKFLLLIYFLCCIQHIFIPSFCFNRVVCVRVLLVFLSLFDYNSVKHFWLSFTLFCVYLIFLCLSFSY